MLRFLSDSVARILAPKRSQRGSSSREDYSRRRLESRLEFLAANSTENGCPHCGDPKVSDLGCDECGWGPDDPIVP